jgi:hypothetical protein
MEINGDRCTFHHMGIFTSEKKPRERHSPLFDMYTRDSDCRTLRIQWHRFEPDSSRHPLLQTELWEHAETDSILNRAKSETP